MWEVAQCIRLVNFMVGDKVAQNPIKVRCSATAFYIYFLNLKKLNRGKFSITAPELPTFYIYDILCVQKILQLPFFLKRYRNQTCLIFILIGWLLLFNKRKKT